MLLPNKLKTYSKAFTVQELLVGLVVSSLIMGMIYGIYVQLNKQLVTYDLTRQELMVFNQFKQLLASDFALANSIEQTGNTTITFDFSDKEYTYQFLSNVAIRTRENNVKDTFAIAIMDFDLNTNPNSFHTLVVHTRLMNETIQLYESKEIELASQINKMYE
jgi:type II secretory pathway component PulJ